MIEEENEEFSQKQILANKEKAVSLNPGTMYDKLGMGSQPERAFTVGRTMSLATRGDVDPI